MNIHNLYETGLNKNFKEYSFNEITNKLVKSPGL